MCVAVGASERLRLFEADLMTPEQFDGAIRGQSRSLPAPCVPLNRESRNQAATTCSTRRHLVSARGGITHPVSTHLRRAQTTSP
jgi:hypothetical protein